MWSFKLEQLFNQNMTFIIKLQENTMLRNMTFVLRVRKIKAASAKPNQRFKWLQIKMINVSLKNRDVVQ